MQDKYVVMCLGIVAAMAVGLAYIFLISKNEVLAQQYVYSQAPTIGNSMDEKTFCDPCVTKTEEVRPTRPHIINHILTDADTWYEIKLPEDVVTWQMRARGDYDLEYSFESSQATTMVLPSGSVLNENTSPNMSIRAIYVRSGTAASQVDLEMWRNLG